MRTLLLAALLGFTAIAVFGAEFSLAPHLTDRLVLQQNADNRIYGRGLPRERVWVEFGRFSKEVEVNTAGEWSVKFDPGRANATGRPLRIWRGKKRTERVEAAVLEDVLVGEVWLVGLSSGQGVPVRPRNAFRPTLRVLTLEGEKIGVVKADKDKKQSPVWQNSDQIDRRQFHSLAYHVAQTLAAKEIPIGIIQMPRENVRAGLRQNHGGEEPQFAKALADLIERVNGEVAKTREDQFASLVTLKHLGIVTNRVEIRDYDPPVLRLREAFDSKLGPASEIAFEGAVW